MTDFDIVITTIIIVGLAMFLVGIIGVVVNIHSKYDDSFGLSMVLYVVGAILVLGSAMVAGIHNSKNQDKILEKHIQERIEQCCNKTVEYPVSEYDFELKVTEFKGKYDTTLVLLKK